MTSMTSTIGATDYDGHYDPFIVCDWCDDEYDGSQSRYCEKCGPVLSGKQIADLMLVVKEMDDFDLASDVYVANVSSLVRELCGKWYDGGDYAYQKMCYEYLETQPLTSKIDKALNFFGGSHRHCDNCGMLHDPQGLYGMHVCR
jgi:hypothetical protein